MRRLIGCRDSVAAGAGRALGGSLAGLLAVLNVGCQGWGGGLGTQRVSDPPLEPNIIQVVPCWSQDPFGPVGGGSKPGGFVIGALYLVAPTEKGGERGVFGDGIIHVLMYVLEQQGEKENRRLVREWLFDPEQARPYRTKKAYVGGYGYQLHCAWGDADVVGKRVELEVSFERKDGQVVHSRPRQYIVPRS
jgi:hypothetical protein